MNSNIYEMMLDQYNYTTVHLKSQNSPTAITASLETLSFPMVMSFMNWSQLTPHSWLHSRTPQYTEKPVEIIPLPILLGVNVHISNSPTVEVRTEVELGTVDPGVDLIIWT